MSDSDDEVPFEEIQNKKRRSGRRLELSVVREESEESNYCVSPMKKALVHRSTVNVKHFDKMAG